MAARDDTRIKLIEQSELDYDQIDYIEDEFGIDYEDIPDEITYVFTYDNNVVGFYKYDDAGNNTSLCVADKSWENVEDLFVKELFGFDIKNEAGKNVEVKLTFSEIFERFLDEFEDNDFCLANGWKIPLSKVKDIWKKNHSSFTKQNYNYEEVSEFIQSFYEKQEAKPVESRIEYTEKDIEDILNNKGVTKEDLYQGDEFEIESNAIYRLKRTGEIVVIPVSKVDKNGPSEQIGKFKVFLKQISHHAKTVDDELRNARNAKRRTARKAKNFEKGRTREQIKEATRKRREEDRARLKAYRASFDPAVIELLRKVNQRVNEQISKLEQQYHIKISKDFDITNEVLKNMKSIYYEEGVDDVMTRLSDEYDNKQKIYTPQQKQIYRTGQSYIRAKSRGVYDLFSNIPGLDFPRKDRENYQQGEYVYFTTLAPVRIAQKQLKNTFFGCLVEATYFQLLVSNTPVDEDYSYKKRIYYYRHKKRPRLRNKDGSVRNEDEVLSEVSMQRVTTYSKKLQTHIADEESVKGDWCIRFRGKTFKAWNSKPADSSDTVVGDVIYLGKELFEKPDDRSSQEKIAEIFMRETYGYHENSIRLDVFNVNPRWQQLEYGRYEVEDTGNMEGRTGSRVHAVKNGYSYQAPYGFKRLVDAMWNMRLTTGGSWKGLANRFISKSRPKLNVSALSEELLNNLKNYDSSIGTHNVNYENLYNYDE